MDPISAYLIQFLVGLAISAAVNLATQAFSPKQEATKQAIRGFRGQYSYGGTTPLRIVLGTYGVAGHLEYRNTWGNSDETPNAFLVDVFSLSDYLINDVTAAWVDTQDVTLPGTGHLQRGYPVPEYELEAKDHLWYEFLDGTQATASAYLEAKFGSDPTRPWESSMVGEGIAQAIMTARINEKLWTGFPTYMFQIEGAPVLDPRESTTLGGTGSQVWGTVSTYEFSDNPVVLIYNILRGIHDADGNHIWGGRASAYQLPYANWAAAMDACDVLVDKKGGGTEKRYRAGIEISVSERPTDVIRELLIGCNGRIAQHQGQYFILIDVPASADGTFTDADVLSNEAVTLSLFPNLDEVVNGATATFMAPGRAWEAKETAPYYRSDLETEDGGRRLLQSLTLRTVFSGSQAQRILKAVVEEARRFKKHVVVLTPGFGVYRPLQVLAWTSTEFGYTSKLWLITSKTEDEWGRIYLALQEIDPSDFDWDETVDETELTFAPLTPIVVPSQAVAGWAVEPFNDGVQPGIHLEWVGALEDIGWTQVLIRLDGVVLPFYDREFPYDTEHDTQDIYILGNPLRPATAYEVSARFIPKQRGDRATDWTAWFAVTTDDVPGFEMPPIDIGMLVEELQNAYALVTDPTIVGGVQEQILHLKQLAALLAQAIIDVGATAKQRLDVLDAHNGGASAAIIDNREAIVTESEARATAITEAVAEVNENFGDGFLKIEAIADEDSSSAAILFKARAIANGLYSQAVARLLASVDGDDVVSTFDLFVDTFRVLSEEDGVAVSPFYTDGITVYIASAMIAAASITSAKIADAAITNAKIDNLAVTAAKIANLAVTSAKIDDLAVTAAKISALAVTSAKIGDLQVERVKIAGAAVTDLVSDTVTNGTTSYSASYKTICSISVSAGNYPIPCGAYLDFTTYSGAVSTTYDIVVDITVNSVSFELAHYTATIAGGVRTKIPLACSTIPALPSGSYTVRLKQKTAVGAAFNHTVHSAKLAVGQPQK